MDGQVTGVKPAMSPLTSISLHQDPLGSSSSLGPPQRGSLTPSNNVDSLCDELSKHEYEDIVEVDYFFGTVNVKGRLKDHIQFWVNIQAPDFILSVMSEGYKLPLLHTPPRSFTRNNLSAINNSAFVTESILALLASGIISEFSKDSFHVINPLSVSTQSFGKRRLILDLRFVNQFILKQKVKFEDYKTALDLFQYGGYACSFDLKCGYHHVDIFPSHQRFLGFSWTFLDGRTRHFAYTILPFGLSLAPYLFTKLMRPLVKYWRSRGLYCIVYLDDGFIMDSTLEKTQRASHLVYGDLVASGFVINQEKSIWCPVQSIVWLGIVWNFENGTIAVTDARIRKIEERLSLILQKKLVSTRELASVTGSVISLSPVFTFLGSCPGTVKFQLQLLQVGILFQNLTLIALLSCNFGFRLLKNTIQRIVFNLYPTTR